MGDYTSRRRRRRFFQVQFSLLLPEVRISALNVLLYFVHSDAITACPPREVSGLIEDKAQHYAVSQHHEIETWNKLQATVDAALQLQDVPQAGQSRTNDDFLQLCPHTTNEELYLEDDKEDNESESEGSSNSEDSDCSFSSTRSLSSGDSLYNPRASRRKRNGPAGKR